MSLLLSVEGLNITSLIIGIVASAIAIIEAIILIVKALANRLSEKTFLVKFEAQPPDYIIGYPRPIVKAVFHFTNKTKADWTVTKMELITNNRTISVSEKDKTIEITVHAKSNRTVDFPFVVPSYFLNLPPKGILKIYVGMKCLEYPVDLPQKDSQTMASPTNKKANGVS